MTKKDFYKDYWPAIKDKPVSIYSGYVTPVWCKAVIIESVNDCGQDVYFRFKADTGTGLRPSTLRSVKQININQ